MTMSTSSILARLAEIQSNNLHLPQETLALGQSLIERGWAKGQDDQVWTVLEQTAIAALESGQLGLAQVLHLRLSAQFPESPRVQVIEGMIMEQQGDLRAAREFYEGVLVKDEGYHIIRKRLITLHLSCPASSASNNTSSKGKHSNISIDPSTGLSRQLGVDHLVQYLDSVYNDQEGWSQLARVYASMGLYAQSLTALSHLILLNPHSPFPLLAHAETAYTMGEVPLAYKEFLRVVEMSEEGAMGVGRRAAMGVKLCLRRIPSLSSSSSSATDPLLRPKETRAIDLITTKLILDAYKSEEGGPPKKRPSEVELKVVREWVGSS